MRRLASSIVRHYPLPWRERYQEEVLELIDDSPVRLHDLGELARGLIVERARALIEDADHPRRTARILIWIQPTFVMAFMASAWALGVTFRGWRPPPPALAENGFVLIQLFALGFFATKIVLFRKTKERSLFGGPIFPAWAGFTLLPVLFAGIAVSSWGSWAGFGHGPFPSAIPMFFTGLMYAFYTAELMHSFWPGAKMLEAIGQLAGADSKIRWARLWIDGCETMIAKGVPSPLDQAQAQLAEGERNRDQALEQLQKLGYRARFQL